jgi:uncharacterized membrane protein HdeD (DUF308 family)
VFGIFALIDGIFAIVAVFVSGAHSESWWWLVIEGAFGILIGILTLIQPAAMAFAWIFVIAAWAIITGILESFTAIKLRKMITNEGWLIVGGVLSVLFGLLVAISPESGLFAVGLIIGIYALIFGITMLMLAFRLRKHAAKHRIAN